MALRTPYANDAKQYDFGYLRHLAETLLNSEGVANYATDMLVTPAGSGLRVDIAAGAAWVKGDSGTPAMGISQGLFSVVNDAAVTNAVTLPTADPTNPRLDQIVLKVRDSADLGSGADDALFEYVQGTPTGGATLSNRNGAAALGNDRLLLADVLVPAAATNLTTANIRDRRIPANGRATKYISTAESTASASYVEMTTPDVIEAYVPVGAFVRCQFNGLVKRSGGTNGAYMLHIIDYSAATPVVNQIKYYLVNGAPQLVDITFNGTVYFPAATAPGPRVNGAPTTTDSSEVTTGMFTDYDGAGLPVSVFGLPGGATYGFSWRYKGIGGATAFAKDRRMSVEVCGNGRSQ